MAKWARQIYYPMIIVVVLSGYLLLLPLVSVQQIPLLVAAMSLASVALVAASEYFWPHRPGWMKSQGDFAIDLVYTNLLLPLLSKGAELLLAWVFYVLLERELQGHIVNLWPRDWPLLIQLPVALLICEFFFYWTHRLGHKIEMLWRFHAIHHAVERVYWNNSGRFHPVDLLLNWFFYFLPMVLLQVPPQLMGLFLTLNAITGLLEHANVDFKAGFLNRIFNTAELHRWHHSVEIEISSKNFGKVLSVWDQVFGTFYLPNNQQVGDVGIRPATVPKGLVGQMIYPFQEIQKSFQRDRLGRFG